MNRPLSILFTTQEDFLAGSTYSVFFLARGLSQRGHRVFIAAREHSLLHQLSNQDQLTFLPFEPKSRFDLNAIRQINRWVVNYDVDIINAQSSKDRYITVFSRWIYNFSSQLIHTRRQVSLSIGGPLQNLVYYRGTDRIVAVGSGVKESLKRGGIPDKHIEVIHNGTPNEKYEMIDETEVRKLKRKFDIQDDDLVIGCISRRKLQDQLLQSLQYIGKPVKVILVGIDKDKELDSIISQYRVSHQIYFEGHVPSKYALNYLKLFKIYVLCSTTEGLSQSLLEAMYMNIPVIATNASGNTDLIASGVNGLLYQNEDTKGLAEMIMLLDSNPQMASRLADMGRETVTRSFSIDATILKYERFFHRMLDEYFMRKRGSIVKPSIQPSKSS